MMGLNKQKFPVKKMKRIWIDGDACPKAIKEILYKAAVRTKTRLTLVANNFLTYPSSPFIDFVKVEKGLDSADSYMIKHIQPNDLAITADIPLAADMIEKKASVISPRGEVFTANEMRQRLNFRDINEQIRGYGGKTNTLSSFSIKEKTAFANALDRWLAKNNNPYTQNT